MARDLHGDLSHDSLHEADIRREFRQDHAKILVFPPIC